MVLVSGASEWGARHEKRATYLPDAATPPGL